MPRPNNLTELAKKVSSINEANGWGIVLADKTDMCLKAALIASEASEALEEWDESRSAGKRKLGDTIAAVQIEFADVMIRVMHLMHAMGFDCDQQYSWNRVAFERSRRYDLLVPDIFRSAIAEHLIQPSFRVFELMRKPDPEKQALIGSILAKILVNSETLSVQLEPNDDIWAIIDAKLEKNASRGFKHGNKVC